MNSDSNSNSIPNIKYWTDSEEGQLIDEINKLIDIDCILQNHNRKITGILMRIEKILNDPIKSIKIYNKNSVIEKYLANTKNKYFMSHDELYSNLLAFNSLEEISNHYNKIHVTKIKNIINDFLKKKDIDIARKLRIKCLLKNDDNLDLAEKIFQSELSNDSSYNISNKINKYQKTNKSNNSSKKYDNDDANKNNEINDTNNTDNMNSVVILLLDEIKKMRTDIFDIRNRVKIIMDKVSLLEKNNLGKTYYSKNNSEIFNLNEINSSEINLIHNSDKTNINDTTHDKLDSKKNSIMDNIIICNNDENIDDENNSFNRDNVKIKKNKKKDNKKKIIIVDNLNEINNNDCCDNNDNNDDELEKEFKKIIG